ncbi:hypothetical protein LLG95_16430 [bacterium]|nr:hypothetical protein [bacterium]
MRPIKKSPNPADSAAAPPAHSIASLRTTMRMGKLPQAQSSPESVDSREPEELFAPLPPSEQEPNEYTLDMNDE